MFAKYEQFLSSYKRKGSPEIPINSKDKDLAFILSVFGNGVKFSLEGKYAGPVIEVKVRPLIKSHMDSSFDGEDFDSLDSIVDHTEACAIFDSYIDIALSEILNKSAFYYNLLDKCVWLQTDDNHRISTLAVSYDPDFGKFVLAYNPSFILKGAIIQYMYASQEYSSLEDCYLYMLKFYLLHEMSHITREHLSYSNTELDQVDPQIVNIFGDSFINQTIPALILEDIRPTPPVIGIINDINMSGTCKESFHSFKSKFSTFLSKTFPVTTHFRDSNVSTKFPNQLGKMIIKFSMGSLLKKPEYIGNLNSSLFIRNLDEFFKSVLVKENRPNLLMFPNLGADNPVGQSSVSGPAGAPSGSSSGNSSGSGGDSSQNGNGGDSSQNGNGGDSSQNGNGGDSSNQGSQGKGSRGSKDPQDEVDKLAEQIVNSIKQALGDKMKSESSGSSGGSTNSPGESGSSGGGGDSKRDDEELKELAKIIKDSISRDSEDGLRKVFQGDVSSLTGGRVVNTKNQSNWKRLLLKLVKQCLGITEVWNSEAPNSRIQGQLGREVEIPAVKNILILLDCSGSMGPDTFKKILAEIPSISSTIKGRPKVTVVYWGSEAFHKVFKLDRNLFKSIKASYEGLGGTDYDQAYLYASSIVRNPDIVIEFTDAHWMVSAGTLKQRRKWNKKTVWVLTDDYNHRTMSMADPSYKRKSIILH